MATIEQIDERIRFHQQRADTDKKWADSNDITATALQRHGDGSEHAKNALGAARALQKAQTQSWHEENVTIRALEAWRDEIQKGEAA